MQISIHAPGKGATIFLLRRTPFQTLFQSTLPGRERRARNGGFRCHLANFNPRSREGSDRDFCIAHKGKKKISIHAPGKGATAKREKVKTYLREKANNLYKYDPFDEV